MTRRLKEFGLIRAGTWDALQLDGFHPREAQWHLGLVPEAVGEEMVPQDAPPSRE